MTAEVRLIHLLIVEDSMPDVRLMKEAIREGCPLPLKISVASDGEEARSLFKTAEFDLIILDVNLPGTTGLELLEQSRPEHGTIVVFTSSSSDEERRAAERLGVKDFVTKPSTYEAYIEAVCGIIERWALRRGRRSALSTP